MVVTFMLCPVCATGGILGKFVPRALQPTATNGVLTLRWCALRQTYPDLQPLYDAARSYLEIPQRINLLNARVEVRRISTRVLRGSAYLADAGNPCVIRCCKTCCSCSRRPFIRWMSCG